MKYITEPEKQVPIIDEYDVCVLGGGCSGVFAAVRAARLGVKVALVERYGHLGGVCTLAMINSWHSIYNFDFTEQIIGGLTVEVLERLKKRNQVTVKEKNINMFQFNTEELKLELDGLVEEAGIDLFLHTLYVSNQRSTSSTVDYILVENKDGRGALTAKVFIDATGDGDLCRDLEINKIVDIERLMPPTPCFRLFKEKDYPEYISKLIREHGEEYGIVNDWGWNTDIPNISKERLCVETHVYDYPCITAKNRTKCEVEGRKQIRAIVDLLRKYMPDGDKVQLAGIGTEIGIRESYKYETEYCLTDEDVLGVGEKFTDSILSSSYPMDIHYPDRKGVVMRYLNGTEKIMTREKTTIGKWKEYNDCYPQCWHAPYRMLLLPEYKNVILAGRMIHCEHGAYSAVRVRINLNQIGEAAGVGAALAVKNQCDVKSIDIVRLQKELKQSVFL